MDENREKMMEESLEKGQILEEIGNRALVPTEGGNDIVPNKLNKLKKWIPLILLILLIFGSGGIYYYINSPGQAMKRLSDLALKKEPTASELIKGGKDARRLFSTKDYRYTDFLMSMLGNSQASAGVKEAILKEINESNQKFIRFDAIMDVYLNSTLEALDNEATRVLKFNSPQENEQLFLKSMQELVKSDQEKALKLILKYKKDNVGALVQVYDLNLDLKFLALSYAKKELSREDFKAFLRGKDSRAVVAVFYEQAKEALEKEDYAFVRALANEPSQLGLIAEEPYGGGFAFMEHLITNKEQVQQLTGEKQALEGQIKAGEPALTLQQTQTDTKKKAYLDQEGQVKKVESSLGKYAPFQLTGRVVKVLKKDKTPYGTAKTYEGAYIRHNFFGEVLSTERFLLRTYKSDLKKNSNFNLEVVDSGTVNVDQESMISTYQQRWPVYDEFTDEMKNSVNNLAGNYGQEKAKSKELKGLYDEENAKLQTLLKEKSVLDEKLQQVQNQMTKLDAETKELQGKVLAIQ